MKRLALAGILLVGLSAGTARAQQNCTSTTQGGCGGGGFTQAPTSVPDSGTTMALLGGALFGLGMLRQRFRG